MPPEDRRPDPSSPEGGFEIPVPKAAAPRRSTRLTAAAAVLLLTGGFAAIGFMLVLSTPHQGSGGTQQHLIRGEALVWLALAALNILAGLLVLRLRPNGRVLGFIVGGIGIVIGLGALKTDVGRGFLTLALAGFVVWVLATEGAAFRGVGEG